VSSGRIDRALDCRSTPTRSDCERRWAPTIRRVAFDFGVARRGNPEQWTIGPHIHENPRGGDTVPTKRPARPKRRTRRPEPERRLDVTRLEYQTLLDLALRNQARVVRLEMEMAIQFKRTVEQQGELDALKKSLAGAKA